MSSSRMLPQNQGLPLLVDTMMTVAVALCVIMAVLGAGLLLAPTATGAARASMVRAEPIDANRTIDAQRDAARFAHRLAAPGGNVFGLH